MKRKPPKQSPSKNIRTCFYCSNPASGKDHVPARAIFRKPFPLSLNLTTLPCCSNCNGEFGKDEEYLLGVLAMISNSNSDLKAHQERVLDWSKKLENQLIESLKVSEDGNSYFVPDIERLSKVALKYTIGMYWRHYGRKLNPANVSEVLVFQESDVPSEIFLSIINMARFSIDKWRVLQRGIFSFVFVKGGAPSGYLWCVINVHKTLIMKATVPAPRRNSSQGSFRKNNLMTSLDQLYLPL